MKDRLKKKLKAKKLREVNKPKNIFPFVPPKPSQPKEYEMPEKYQKNLRILTEMIEERDQKAEIIKTLPPAKRAEALPALAEFSASIDKVEQTLANEYKEFQEEMRRKDEVTGILDKGMEQVEKLFIIMKHQMPHLFDEFKKIVVEGMTPEGEQEFYDKIAVLEATQLKEILAGK